MSFFQDNAMRAEAGLRIERLQREFPARRPRRWRRADRVAARGAAALQSRPVDVPGTAAVVLVAAEVRAVIEAHVRVPEQRLPEQLPPEQLPPEERLAGQRLPDQLPQTSMARPGQ